MLKIANLHKNKILQDLSFTLSTGEVLGVIGPSGAGKSTLLRCINGIIPFDRGEIIFEGQALHTANRSALVRARQRMGMVFQQFNLIAQKTVFDNVALPLQLTHSPAQQTEQVLELLKVCHIVDKKDAYPSELSGGQKQRVAIARALALKPALLLCDEATSALDPQSTRHILELLRSLVSQFQLSILLVTHEMDVIKTLCDRAIVLDQGAVVESGPVLDLFVKPQHPVTKNLVQKNIHLELPSSLGPLLEINRAPNQTVGLYRLAFTGKSSTQPLLSHVIMQYQVTINILQAHIEQLQNKTLGFMLATLSGAPMAIENSIHFLQQQGCVIEKVHNVA